MYIYTFPQICPQTSCNFHAPMTHDINSKMYVYALYEMILTTEI